MERFTERFVRALYWAIVVIEVCVAVALVFLAGATLVSLTRELLHLGGTGFLVTSRVFNQIIGTILEIFILVELFRIAVAYMRHNRVVTTVLEAALVAVARKFVVLEGGEDFLQIALGMSALLLAVAVSWWMLAKAGVPEDSGL